VNKISRSYQNELLKSLTDSTEAAAYLNAALDDGSKEVFLLALQNVAEAGRLKDMPAKFRENAELTDHLSSDNGDIRLCDLSDMFVSLGIRFTVEAK